MSSPFTCISRRWWLLLLLLTLAVSARAQSIERALMPGQVIAAHAKYEEDCQQCHQRFDKAAQPRLCAGCHKEIGSDIAGKRGYHGHLDDPTCNRCHTEHKGRDARLVVLDKRKFDHDGTGFALKGAHRGLAAKCESCHLPKRKFRDASPQCLACHGKDDVHKGSLGKQCENCHGEAKWTEAKFDHDKTRFRLEDKHAKAECKACHADKRYQDTPLDCHSCHKKDDAKNGHHGRFGSKCETCHTAKAWTESKFDHARDAHFRLKGKHERAECTACHKATLYQPPKTPTACVACHRKDDSDKGHKGSLGDKCDSCHNEQGGKKTSFDHDTDTDYPLEGKHRDAKCESCHKSGLKPAPGAKAREKLPTQCVACHRQDDKDKGHKGKFGDKCDTCHSPLDWKKTKFDHDRDTKYLLRGRHRETKCADCHQGTLYVEKLGTECIACHRKLDDDKGHRGQLATKCGDCHDEKSWKGAKYDHNKSRFPLTGRHLLAECAKCHQTPRFRDAGRACFACHERDDVHKQRFGTECQQCHNTRTWKSWDFDHGKTRFPLSGAHRKVRCESCHKVPIHGRVTLSVACVDCHFEQDVHRGGFGGQCERCHDDINWKRLRR